MPPELTLRRAGDWRAFMPQVWRGPLLRLALAWAGSILLFRRDWADMAHQWWDSSTYNHILLVPFILGWLVKLRLPELLRLRPQGWWPAVIPAAGALFVWLLGSISGLSLASQLGAVALLPIAVLGLLGPRVCAALTFPLCYFAFLVPFGDVLIPPLQTITAEITIALTHLSGIPAEIEGVFIDTPVGLFEVAEACSGVKFLIAMIALGVLVAHVCFRSALRRTAFLAAALVLPIVANGVRAWGTIYIAQSQGVEFAAGFDHIFYGWIFFALVMGLLLLVGWRFFDRDPDDSFVDVAALDSAPIYRHLDAFAAAGWNVFAAFAVMTLGVAGWSVAAHRLEAVLPDHLALPAVAGWQQVPYRPAVWWEPRASGAVHRLLARYSDGEGHAVDVFYALYAAQDEGREAGGFGQGALMPDSEWRWLEPGPSPQGGKGEWLQARGTVRRLALTWYRTGGTITGSNARLKLANMADRLAMRERPTAVLILSAEERPGHPSDDAIAAFLRAAGPPAQWMDRAAQLP